MTTNIEYTQTYSFSLPEGVTLNRFKGLTGTITPFTFDSDQATSVNVGYPTPTSYKVTSNTSSVIAEISVSSTIAGSITTASCHIILDLSSAGGWEVISDLTTYPNDIPCIVSNNMSNINEILIEVVYTRTYLLAPGAKVNQVIITNQAAGYFTLNSQAKDKIEVTGGTDSSAPTAVLFSVYNTSPYSTASISMEYYVNQSGSTNSVLEKPKNPVCTITFKLTGTNWWEQQGSTILAGSGNSQTLPIVPPSGNTGAGPETLNKEMVYLLDVNSNGNILFRGNSPLSGHDKPIDFKTLHNYMKEQYDYQANGVTKPKPFPKINNYVLCEIALLSTASETYEIDYSIASYGKQTTQEKLQSQINLKDKDKVLAKVSGKTPYPEHPISTPTYTKDGEIYGQMLLWNIQPDSDSYDLDRAKDLFSMVNKASEHKVRGETIPIVYYIHCCNGHDRTGIVSSIYMIEKSHTANPETNSNTDLTEQYIRGTTINLLLASENGPQLYTTCKYYNGINKGSDALHKSRCFLIHAADNPQYSYRKTVETVYNTIKSNSSSDMKFIKSDAEQEDASTKVYVMDEPSVVPSLP